MKPKLCASDLRWTIRFFSIIFSSRIHSKPHSQFLYHELWKIEEDKKKRRTIIPMIESIRVSVFVDSRLRVERCL